MNTSRRIAAECSLLLLLLGFLVAFPTMGAESLPGVVKVQAILGQAQFSKAGGAFTPLGPGMVLRQGDLVQTASDSAVDLYLGEIPGTVRMTQSTTLIVDKVMTTAPDGTPGFDVQFTLRGGELVGHSKPVPEGSRFEIKLSSGITHVTEGRFRIDAGGRVVVLEGKAVVAHVPPGGEAAVHTLAGPPAVYFAPLEGVQPASKELVKEIARQMRSKLPRR